MKAAFPIASVEPAHSVHLIGGLPTAGVERGFARVRGLLDVFSFAEFVGSSLGEASPIGVLLPPYLETSQLVEDWEGSSYLPGRLGGDAHIGNVITVVDTDSFVGQLCSPEPISAHGWGKNAHDSRTVADITAGQVESATHLLLIGEAHSSEAVEARLKALNPTAERVALDEASDDRLREFLSGARVFADHPQPLGSAKMIPPWLALLQAEPEAPSRSDRFVYRRSCPFDPDRFGEWLMSPPSELVRGKGHLWLANRCDQSFGYSCAGHVHRVFAAGQWWATYGGAAWPTCDVARRRLLRRWHPEFGDRCQEIAFIGIDLNVADVCSRLDSCLLSYEETLELISSAMPQAVARGTAAPRVGFH
jgi:G3E family GTPase